VSAPGHGKPEPGDALGAEQRSASGDGLASTIGHHYGVACEQRHDLVPIAAIRRGNEALEHTRPSLVVDEVALSSRCQALARAMHHLPTCSLGLADGLCDIGV